MDKKIKITFLLLILFLTFIVVKYFAHPEQQEMKNKVFLIGLDGATFDIILPMVKEGKLPNFAKLLEECSWGNLTSIPPDSPIQWTSIITGTKAEKHGMYDFGYRSNGKFIPFNITSIKTEPLWRILSYRGKKVGVIDWLFSWPFEEVNGFMILGGRLSPERSEYLRLLFNSSLNSSLQDEWIDAVMKFEKYKETITLNLTARYNPDFLAYTSYVPDDLQHLFWRYREPKYFDVTLEEHQKYGRVIENGYKNLDNFIGNFIHKNLTLIIVSDHGFHRGDIVGGPILIRDAKGFKDIVFRLNYLLYKMGLLSFDEGEETINFDQTEAYFCNNFSFSGICISSKDEKEKGEITEKVAYLLSKVQFENGEKVFASIKKLKGDGPNVIFSLHPDLFNESNLVYGESGKVVHATDKPTNIEYVVINESKIEKILFNNLTIKVSEIVDFLQKLGGSGRHAINGIAIFCGKNVRKGKLTNIITPTDIAPTILYLLGEKIPENMDGRVLTEVITKEYLQNYPIKYTIHKKLEPNVKGSTELTEEHILLIKQKLKELGYLTS